MEPINQSHGEKSLPPDDPRRRRKYKNNDMTEEELRVMDECQRDSLYLRALPFSAGCMLATQYLVKSGRWSPHPRFGAIPKTIIFGSFGYLAGKISYVPVCRQKVLDQIPHSNIAKLIQGLPQDNQPPNENDMESQGRQSFSKTQDEYSTSSSQAPSKFSESSAPAGIDDRFRPSLDNETKNENVPEEEQKKMTYEEMRRRNRQQYEEKMAKQSPKPPGEPSYKESPMMPQKPWPDARNRLGKSDVESSGPSDQTPTPPPSQGPPKKKRTNIWGDVIED